MEKEITAFRFWGNDLYQKKTDMGWSKIVEGSKHKLFNRTLIIFHSRMKTAECEHQIPTNNDENRGQIIQTTFGRYLASNGINNSKVFPAFVTKTPILEAIKKK